MPVYIYSDSAKSLIEAPLTKSPSNVGTQVDYHAIKSQYPPKSLIFRTGIASTTPSANAKNQLIDVCRLSEIHTKNGWHTPEPTERALFEKLSLGRDQDSQ